MAKVAKRSSSKFLSECGRTAGGPALRNRPGAGEDAAEMVNAV